MNRSTVDAATKASNPNASPSYQGSTYGEANR
jgi:hypothetical protein